ncbi:hypothetical protein ACGF3C_11125 [Micromonospora sp. NPDC047762]|uniref:hypothetical protein n=1 Tax=Micromonospora sp. NPDC047762 TaxID=3364255 RepID=UPI00371843BB
MDEEVVLRLDRPTATAIADLIYNVGVDTGRRAAPPVPRMDQGGRPSRANSTAAKYSNGASRTEPPGR